MAEAPRVWCILANSIWANAESLPSSVSTTERKWGMSRAYRPDSLLWEFNHFEDGDLFGAGVHEANNLAVDFGALANGRAVNPAPPTGSPGDLHFPNLAESHIQTVASWSEQPGVDAVARA
jgi:hypothetical protein